VRTTSRHKFPAPVPLLLALVLTLASALPTSRPAAADDLGHSKPGAGPADGQPGKVIPDHYIVTLKEGSDPQAVAGLAGVNPTYVYTDALTGFAAQLNPDQLAALKGQPEVEAIEPDQEVSADAIQYMNASGQPWGLDRIDQRNLPLSRSYTYTYFGYAVRVYVLDTGLQPNHPDFGGRALNVFDAFGGNGMDCNGHGTHVAGTVGGATYGVAKGANLRGVKVLGNDCTGRGTSATIIAGVDWVRRNAIRPAVANMSLRVLGYSAALNTAVANLINAGVFVAVAAGNDNGNACHTSPASTLGAYTVAASDWWDTRYSFSNYGPCVDGYAPGVLVTSTWLNGGTATLTGTSMAAPHVAGVAALYKATFGDDSAATITTYINRNATYDVIRSNPSGYWTPNRLLFKGTL
jgi:subtilisin family serine protease